MANDRIWIYCLTCEERKLITKHYPGEDLGELWRPEELTDWISEHLSHHPLSETSALHLHNNPGLFIATEAEASGELVEDIYRYIVDARAE